MRGEKYIVFSFTHGEKYSLFVWSACIVSVYGTSFKANEILIVKHT
jgi:hypothetical protein